MAGILRPTAAGRIKTSDLEGHLVAITTRGIDTYEPATPGGETWTFHNAIVLDITPTETIHHDSVWISQKVLMQQLDRTSEKNPWIVGRIQKRGRAYILDDVNDTEFAAAAKAIDEWNVTHGRGTDGQDDEF